MKITLLDIADIVKPEQNKTNIYYYFDINEIFDNIEVFYSYSPKEIYNEEICYKYILDGLEHHAKILDNIQYGYTKTIRQRFLENWKQYIPLTNHITLSLDIDGEYIGALHNRKPEQYHIISSKISSNGFIPTKIKKGKWCIMLNIHSVIELVNYKLKVIGNKN